MRENDRRRTTEKNKIFLDLDLYRIIEPNL